MDPLVTSSLIGAGASLAGGFLGAASSSSAARINAKAQEAYATRGVQMRVKDALAAGVHPLFALGASTTGYTPTHVGKDYSFVGDAGEKIARGAVASSLAKEDRALAAIQAKVAESQINSNDAQAAEARSRAFLNLKALRDQPSVLGEGDDPIVRPYSDAVNFGRTASEDEFFRRELVPGDSLTVTQHAERGGQWVNFGTGPIWLPRGDPDQLMSDLQDMDSPVRLMIIQMNRRMNTEGNLTRLFGEGGSGREYGKQFGYGAGPVGPGGGAIPRGYRERKSNGTRGWSDYGERY